MALEDPKVLKEKNRHRLRDVINSTFALGINVTAPSRFKDSLRIISIILLIASWIDIYGHYAYIERHKDNLIMMAESISTLLQTLISIFKLTYMTFVQHRFYGVLRKIETHELVDQIDLLTNKTPYNKELRKDAIEILDQCWKVAKGQFTFYMFACSAIISYYFFGAITINAYNAKIGNTNHTNGYAFPVLFPFWEHKDKQFPYYPIMTFMGGSGAYIAGIGALSFDGLFVIYAMHGVALFRILKKMIVFTTAPQVPKELRIDYLRQCIFHYERTYQYCIDVNNLFLHISLVQFLFSLVIWGAVMFQGVFGLESDFMIFFRMVLYILAAGYEVVIYCLNGQFVTTESETLPFAWYECDWYDESKEFKWLIRMMVMRSNRVTIMRASWFTSMSLPTLMAILKTSGSYFLLLRNLY